MTDRRPDPSANSRTVILVLCACGVAGLLVTLVLVAALRGDAGNGGRTASAETQEQEEMRRRKEALCVQHVEDLASLVVVHEDPSVHRVYVGPDLWNLYDFKTRTVIAAWAATCRFDTVRAEVWDGQTGKRIATWSTLWGYSAD